MKAAERLFDKPGDHHQRERDHVEIRGDGEDGSRLADAAQVAVQHDQHHGDGDGDRVRHQPAKCRRQGGGACRRLHGDRHRVVDEQGHRGHLRDVWAEVVPSHHVGAAALRVHADDLDVRDHHEDHHREDRQRDRESPSRTRRGR